MKRDPILKQSLIVFVGVLILYTCAFKGIEYFRTVKGPWEVTFRSDSNGLPSLVISQASIGLTNMTVTFDGEAIDRINLSETMRFDSPKTNIPFGGVLFFDTTVLPGTLTFNLFGHEIEFLPRVMIANHDEVPWESDGTVHFNASNKLPSPPAP